MTPGPYETGKHTELAREPPCTTLPALFPKMSTETSLKYLLNFVSNILMFHSFCFSSPVPSLPQTLSEVWLIRPLPSLHIPLPRVQLVVSPLDVFNQNLPMPGKKKQTLPIAISYKSYFPKLV